MRQGERLEAGLGADVVERRHAQAGVEGVVHRSRQGGAHGVRPQPIRLAEVLQAAAVELQEARSRVGGRDASLDPGLPVGTDSALHKIAQ